VTLYPGGVSEDPRLVSLGLRVRQLRLERGWSQSELAARVGIHRNYVRSIENGQRNISVRNLFALAEGLGVHVVDLLEPIVGEGPVR
jgi:transcriptional regulator with XRE-family HTH domain